MTEQIEQPAGVLRYRDATTLGVSFPERTIELVAMPYNVEALVPINGRMVRESIAPGAFDGIERRPNRVRVNRDHQRERTCGKTIAFYPSREEGLVAEVYISRTPLGDETLALADEGILDASAGYLPMAGGEQWSDGRTRVRMTRCWLGHIALTPDPAYESARVLAVRQQAADAAAAAPVATPNLDQVRAWLIAERYDHLSR